MELPSFFRGIFPDTNHFSPGNIIRSGRCFINEIDDMPPNRMVIAHINEVISEEPLINHPQEVIDRFNKMMELVRRFPLKPLSQKPPPTHWKRGGQ